MTRLLSSVLFAIVIAAALGSALSAECPQCYKYYNPPTGHGTSADGRAVLNVVMAGSMKTFWGLGSHRPEYLAAVNCAMQRWNSAQASDGSKIPFFFQLSTSDPDVQIFEARKVGGVGAGWAQSLLTGDDHARKTTMYLASKNRGGNIAPDVLCGRIAHELGHKLGLMKRCNGQTDTIMSGTNTLTGDRPFNTISASDVASVRLAFDNPSSCTVTVLTEVGEPPLEGEGGNGGPPDAPGPTGPEDPGNDWFCQPLDEPTCRVLCALDIFPPDFNCNGVSDYVDCGNAGYCSGIVGTSQYGIPGTAGVANSGTWGPKMYNTAISGCSNYSELAPVPQLTWWDCYDHCKSSGADACEWSYSTLECFVEFGSGCVVQDGFPGWTAAVINAGGGPSGGPAGGGERQISLGADNGQYMVAEGGGGQAVNADRNWTGPWETFTLVDLNGGDLWDGDEVALRTESGWYLQAVGGGGGAFRAEGGAIGAWETFRVRVQSGSDGRIDHSEWLALETSNGHYVVAEGGGGQVVNADRTGVGAWERFRLYVH